jgi:thiamine-phosphate diphosphorylase
VRPALPKLHAVTDGVMHGLPDLSTRAQQIGCTANVALHARAGDLSGRRLYALATELGEAARAGGARLFVNDRVDVAVIVGADGVHLPSAGLPVPATRRIAGSRWIGCSTHSADEARRRAAEGADYVFLGPIWETPSHPQRRPLGPETIDHAQPARVIAIGGVTPQRVSTCLEAGAYGVAAVSALWGAPDPGAAALEMLLLLEQW